MVERKEVKGHILIPPHIFCFIVNSRENTWASGRQPDNINRQTKEEFYFYTDPTNASRTYFDRYRVNTHKPNTFTGWESVFEEGRKVIEYTYNGVLTKKGQEIGDKVVYNKLKEFLRDLGKVTRIGNDYFLHEKREKDPSGNEIIWTYKTIGRILPSGWRDEEIFEFNGIPVHTLKGIGKSFFH